MKQVLKIFVVLFIMVVSVHVLAQSGTPSPAPSAGAVIQAPAPVTSGLASWVHNQGGLIAAVGVIVACLNIVFSTLAQLFAKLSMAEPVVLQTIGNVLLKATQYISSNTPTPAPQVQAALDKNKAAS
jgi:hypothetical protein